MTLGSLFDGIGGWQIAAVRAGVKPLWSSEIESFPMAVTKKWFPDTKQLGDITKIKGDEIEHVDIICAGSPCQDLSVAGKRAGLEGERSGLFRKAVDIVREMRRATNGRYPRYFVWENVPGAFSSNKGADFRAVLEEIGQTDIPMPANGRWANAGMVECKECEIAWRVLDAQYWGVPQRRKRIFLVADFAKTDRCAGKVLFVEQGLPRDNSESEGERESSPRKAESSTGETGTVNTFDVRFTSNGTLTARGHCYTTDKSRCLDTGGGNPDSNHGGVVCIENKAVNERPDGDVYCQDKTWSLAAGGGKPGQGYMATVQTVGALCADDHKSINNQYVGQDKCVIEGFDEYNFASTGEKSRALASRDYKGGDMCNHSMYK